MFYNEKNFMNNRDVNAYGSRQYYSAVQLTKDLKKIIEDLCLSHFSIAMDTGHGEPFDGTEETNMTILIDVFKNLRRVHERQARNLQHFKQEANTSSNFYYNSMMEFFDDSPETRLCIQCVSYKRGKARYAQLMTNDDVHNIWKDLYTDASMNYSYTLFAIKELGLERMYDLVLRHEYDLMKKIDEFKAETS